MMNRGWNGEFLIKTRKTNKIDIKADSFYKIITYIYKKRKILRNADFFFFSYFRLVVCIITEKSKSENKQNQKWTIISTHILFAL